uniref:RRM domain-containing protein n=1 Tax=Zosterops lateralis melanops TaxID=1220523 RepID=A0A8D2PIN8_ZOSLA
ILHYIRESRVFLYTTERDLREVFSRYGPLTGVNVVYDQRTGRSRGFAFVYFERIDDSKEVNAYLGRCAVLFVCI